MGGGSLVGGGITGGGVVVVGGVVAGGWGWPVPEGSEEPHPAMIANVDKMSVDSFAERRRANHFMKRRYHAVRKAEEDSSQLSGYADVSARALLCRTCIFPYDRHSFVREDRWFQCGCCFQFGLLLRWLLSSAPSQP